MSRELIVLSPRRPDVDALRVPGLDIRNAYVFDEREQLLVRIDVPVLVPVAGEVERLLGVPVTGPVWWVELRAAAGSTHAAEVLRRCADELAARHDGTVWSAR
ncbi:MULTISPECIES: hypothetical protein [Actinomadura]|uniref:hypothetical protein n=1 Tax=Actinomadura TaxID=1988 RepID=UPI00041C4319|nr:MULTISPECIES: hypothetical protein [Actinomadura]RSN48370.1 hypothetical protein DMH08_34220 [Actinomadura sp. WAC 06369]